MSLNQLETQALPVLCHAVSDAAAAASSDKFQAFFQGSLPNGLPRGRSWRPQAVQKALRRPLPISQRQRFDAAASSAGWSTSTPDGIKITSEPKELQVRAYGTVPKPSGLWPASRPSAETGTYVRWLDWASSRTSRERAGRRASGRRHA